MSFSFPPAREGSAPPPLFLQSYNHITLPQTFFFIYLFFYFSQVSRAITDSCPVSKETVEIVDNCPVTEEKWREAAAGKNCEAYASQCGEPERLVYHCVINAFINQTLEVCAYMRVIVLGRIQFVNLSMVQLCNLLFR